VCNESLFLSKLLDLFREVYVKFPKKKIDANLFYFSVLFFINFIIKLSYIYHCSSEVVTI